MCSFFIYEFYYLFLSLFQILASTNIHKMDDYIKIEKIGEGKLVFRS